jgi:uncharacterized membrane protein
MDDVVLRDILFSLSMFTGTIPILPFVFGIAAGRKLGRMVMLVAAMVLIAVEMATALYCSRAFTTMFFPCVSPIAGVMTDALIKSPSQLAAEWFGFRILLGSAIAMLGAWGGYRVRRLFGAPKTA